MNQARYLLIGAAVVALIFGAVWWQRRQMVAALPTRIVCTSLEDAWFRAGSTAFPVLGTGSMAPFIPPAPKGSDPMFTIVAYAKPDSRPFEAIRKGDLVVYRPSWAKGLIIHQAVQKQGNGWIMSGLNNSQSESYESIGADKFVCIIEKVYVW